MPYVTLHFRDRRDAVLLRHGNRVEITVHVCEQNPYPVCFSGRPQSYPVYIV